MSPRWGVMVILHPERSRGVGLKNKKSFVFTWKTKDFSYKDIKKCFIKFKKYDVELNVDTPLTKNIEIDSIDDDFLVKLKIEYDEKFGDNDEKIEIETE